MIGINLSHTIIVSRFLIGLRYDSLILFVDGLEIVLHDLI